MIGWFEHRQVYVPSPVLDTDPQPGDCGLAPHEEVFLTTSDRVKLHAWFFPAAQSSPRSSFALLVFHGNAGNICHRVDFIQTWRELGVSVFIFDYRGYGRSEGEPSEAGTYLDGEVAFDWLVQRGFTPARIVLLGKSLGGGIASEIALRRPPAGLILQNTFTSITDVGSELFPFLPVRLLGKIKYETMKKLPRIQAPVMVMHSRGDSFIRFRHAERNFAAANEPKMLWEIYGSHNGTLEADREHYRKGLDQFFSRYIAKQTIAA
jgi:alpha-beta hydrolase superfamily lysophospholipase